MNTKSRRITQALALALAMTGAAPLLAQSRERMVGPEQIQSYWIMLNTKVDADIPNSGRNMDKPGCVAVSYMIGSDGIPQNVTVRKVVPQSDLDAVAKSVVSNFRYGPALKNGTHEPVNTYFIVPFNLPADPAQRQSIINACKLPGYEQA
ncbi:energy transducer TonB [Dyella japonica]|uniref:Energy transducer TonB n=1 Tax=Dyella japonica A8 TaxID=1217721 RepID=A0A075K5K5_9GAMM|nr:energy transducer TonB [Dyella japonica]AIF49405.1 energy transducer TonB [Dyella japonica A8]